MTQLPGPRLTSPGLCGEASALVLAASVERYGRQTFPASSSAAWLTGVPSAITARC